MSVNWSQRIFGVESPQDFNALALEIFRWQAKENATYGEYVQHLGIHPSDVGHISEIPFLPISLFKTHEIITGSNPVEQVFTSSGTTGSVQSKHHVTDLKLYETSFRKGFEQAYGNPEDWLILALLPSYLEREGSSLIYMADALINSSKHPYSGFYLDEFDALKNVLKQAQVSGTKTLLLGVSFALLDLVETGSLDLSNITIMETGGMKGRRKELIREELHQILCEGLNVAHIHSEYGMTELLSQAYSKGKGIFHCPPWMNVLTRQVNDPLSIQLPGKNGGINIIDLANVNSCSFIATQDLGRVYEDGSFEVLGRFDNSDIRGCNLLV